MQKAEEFATKQLSIKHLLMSVLADRVELIEFYERRGYIRTKKIEDYPIHLNVCIPKHELYVVTLAKYIKKTC